MRNKQSRSHGSRRQSMGEGAIVRPRKKLKHDLVSRDWGAKTTLKVRRRPLREWR